MKKYAIHKLGGAGLMMLYKKLVELVRYIVKDVSPNTQIIIVVSALAKITRMLQDIFEKKLSEETEKALQILTSVKKIHLQRCNDLLIKDYDKLYEYFYEIEYFISHGIIDEENSSISKAQLLKFGELMSSEIFYQFLIGMNLTVKLIDAQKMIYAYGDDYCNSIPLLSKTSECVSKQINSECGNEIILTQGYICNERLLGLDGSDLTAGLISHGLQTHNPSCSTKLAFWKDVDGVYDAKGVYKPNISYKEYLDLQTTPVRKDAIVKVCEYKPKIIIRSFLNLNHQGTIISW